MFTSDANNADHFKRIVSSRAIGLAQEITIIKHDNRHCRFSMFTSFHVGKIYCIPVWYH